MKFSKLLVAGAIIAGLSVTSAMADYNKGFKYYNKYVKRAAHLKSPQMIKLLGVVTTDELQALFKDNAQPLIAKLKAKGNAAAAKGVEKIVKKGKLGDLKDFLVGIMNGNIPAGCS